MSRIVAEYDYYTLDQARKIILQEEKQRKRENMELYIAIAAFYMIPFLMILHWIAFGY